MNAPVCDLTNKHCKPCEGGVPPLTQEEIDRLMQDMDGWTQEGQAIAKTYRFKNYYETMAFVNATAWVSHREDHHPGPGSGLQPVHRALHHPRHRRVIRE